MSFPRSSYTGFPFDAESVRDEFPFNRRGSRDANLQSTLNNIAQKHPELAEHLTNFNQTPKPRNPTADEFKARFRRPFGDHSSFPFGDDDIDLDEYTKQFYNPQGTEEYCYPQNSSFQEQPRRDHSNPQSSKFESAKAQQNPASENPKTPEKELNSNLQQSSTTDLGQRQEPIDDRNQRSMSAPPGGETKKRFTSSINIPINNPPENMAQQNQNQQHESKPNERIIPIQVEGRDGPPVMPKNPHIPQQNQSQSRPEQIFGQSPETFTQFVRPTDSFGRRGFPEDHHFGRQGFQDEHFNRHDMPQNFQQREYHPREEVPIPVQKEVPRPHQQQTQRQQPHQQQQPQPEQPKPEPKPEPPKPQAPIEQIQVIRQDVSKLMEQVEQFNGKPRDKEYLYLDEMLTRNLLKLDNIDTQGQEDIRASRKEAIKCIQDAISQLEAKAAMNVAGKPESEQQAQILPKNEQMQEPTGGKIDTDNSKKEEQEKMDTEQAKEPSEKMDTTENASGNSENVNELAITESKVETRAVLVSDIKAVTQQDASSAESNTSKDSVNDTKQKHDKKGKKKEQ